MCIIQIENPLSENSKCEIYIILKYFEHELDTTVENCSPALT
jgi:hypothetical protein